MLWNMVQALDAVSRQRLPGPARIRGLAVVLALLVLGCSAALVLSSPAGAQQSESTPAPDRLWDAYPLAPEATPTPGGSDTAAPPASEERPQTQAPAAAPEEDSGPSLLVLGAIVLGLAALLAVGIEGLRRRRGTGGFPPLPSKPSAPASGPSSSTAPARQRRPVRPAPARLLGTRAERSEPAEAPAPAAEPVRDAAPTARAAGRRAVRARPGGDAGRRPRRFGARARGAPSPHGAARPA